MNHLPIPILHHARSKTVATIGPASSQPDVLRDLILAGVDVFRLNMAHSDRATHQHWLTSIRNVAGELHQPVAVLVDLAGPKIRLGELAVDPLMCETNGHVVFRRGETPAVPHELVSNYERLLDELEVGDSVMLADGTVHLEVVEHTGETARCRIVEGGEVRSRQGVNLPGVKLSVSAMDESDRDNVRWAAENGVDFVSLSFVRTATEIRELKGMLESLGSEAQVIAKIEKQEALDNLHAIVHAADGIMVARGDLGVEIDIAQTAVVQKRIIRLCRDFGKPVIVATQMLESMHHSTRPTRAEVADVSNAILDGADACMLSGETAIGDYPVVAVKMMQRIMLEAERTLYGRPSRTDFLRQDRADASIGVVYGASQIAKQLDARLMVIATNSRKVLLAKSKQRDFIPTLCVTDSETAQRRACLYWGIVPVRAEAMCDLESVRLAIEETLRNDPSLSAEDRMVIVSSRDANSTGLDTINVDRVPHSAGVNSAVGLGEEVSNLK